MRGFTSVMVPPGKSGFGVSGVYVLSLAHLEMSLLT